MSRDIISNMAQSVFARIKNLSIERRQDFGNLLIRYATERFLYRLASSPYGGQFVLKGGNLFVIWQNGDNSRPTVDSDLLCFGEATPEHLEAVFREVASTGNPNEDGIRFDCSKMAVSPIREETEYGGTRVSFQAFIARTRIVMQFDIGIGDAITPAPELVEFPVLLDHPAPRLNAYPMPTTIAEKMEAMASRGSMNSRMKDYFDLWLLAELFEHDMKIMKLAIANTFARRGTPLPDTLPPYMTEELARRPEKPLQWKAFVRKNKLDMVPQDFAEVMRQIVAFIGPVLEAQTGKLTWIPGEGWR